MYPATMIAASRSLIEGYSSRQAAVLSTLKWSSLEVGGSKDSRDVLIKAKEWKNKIDADNHYQANAILPDCKNAPG